MLNVRFENSKGVIYMGGGSHPNIKIREIDGLSLPDKKRTTEEYYGIPGQELINEHIQSRTITMSVDIIERNLKTISDIARILNYEGKLIIKDARRERAIKASCTGFEVGKRNGYCRQATMQFVCDNPYFNDKNINRKGLYIIEANLTNPFILPAEFSRITTRSVVLNSGDVESEPIITVSNVSNESASSSLDLVEIVNYTKSTRIGLSYSFAYDESLIIDVSRRMIVSSFDTSTPIYCFDKETILGDFVLDVGENDIEVQTDSDKVFSVAIEFEQNYLEALI